eukprot:scaffold33488_cov32-Tisochrysis_lutea.AAC.1
MAELGLSLLPPVARKREENGKKRTAKTDKSEIRDYRLEATSGRSRAADKRRKRVRRNLGKFLK